MRTIKKQVNGKTLELKEDLKANYRYSRFSLSIDGVPKLSWGEGDTSCLDVLSGKADIETLIQHVKPEYL